jgi:uncharacterized protein YbjT (DUF2867 family)
VSRVTVLAATGPVGRRLVERLVAEGREVVAVGRDPARLEALSGICDKRVADFEDPSAMVRALREARLVACCGNAVHLPAILAAVPAGGIERLVVMGSTRRYSAVPDATADAVRAAERALQRLSIPSVLLLSTMIYGTGNGVLDRLARFPVVPVPQGARIQPIHVEDVARALAAALFRPEAVGSPIVLAGPEPMSYAEAVRRTASARGKAAIILPLPRTMFAVGGRLLGSRRVGMELRRLAENRVFAIDDLRQRLGVEPRAFDPAG